MAQHIPLLPPGKFLRKSRLYQVAQKTEGVTPEGTKVIVFNQVSSYKITHLPQHVSQTLHQEIIKEYRYKFILSLSRSQKSYF